MFIGEELEFHLGSRVKSVLIVALAAFLVAQQGMMVKEEPYSGAWAQTSSSGSEIYAGYTKENNPIDEYFEGLAAQVKGPVAEMSFANIYLDSWERELLRAYEMLNSVSGDSPDYGRQYVGDAAKQFSEFAETQGWMEAYFSIKGTESDVLDSGVRTDILVRNKVFGKAQLTRWLTLRIYGLLKEDGLQENGLQENGLQENGQQENEWDGGFAFEKETAQKALQECGIF